MNYYDAQQIMRLHAQGQPVQYRALVEAQNFMAFGAPQSKLQPAQEPIYCGEGCACLTDCGDWYEVNGEPIPPKRPVASGKAVKAGDKPRSPSKPRDKRVSHRAFIPAAPTMATLCTCGLRYGLHRVGDYACMNQKWRPGNGQAQWLANQRFKRA